MSERNFRLRNRSKEWKASYVRLEMDRRQERRTKADMDENLIGRKKNDFRRVTQRRKALAGHVTSSRQVYNEK